MFMIKEERSETNKYEYVIVGLIILFGSIIRVIHIFFVGFRSPFHRGGLFLEFANQIAKNKYLLPHTIPFYTDGGIPFAYPPLPFYFEAILVYGIGLPKFLVVNILPPIIACLTIPSFYLLTRVYGLKIWSRLFALLAFAIIPNAAGISSMGIN